MTDKVGTIADLYDLHDVSYTYTYTMPDGKSDVSKEKYIFDGELSLGEYIRHDRSLTQLEGPFTQGYDGHTFWIKHNGSFLQDSQLIARTIFNRKTNYYWFTMMQKLMDPGLFYTHVGQKTIDDQEYDVVKITFDSEEGEPTDIYQVYINQSTKLIDQFLFTVVDYDVVETPFLMRVEYESVNGILIPSLRKYTKANWDADPLNDQWVSVEWSDISFDNGFSKALFKG